MTRTIKVERTRYYDACDTHTYYLSVPEGVTDEEVADDLDVKWFDDDGIKGDVLPSGARILSIIEPDPDDWAHTVELTGGRDVHIVKDFNPVEAA
jgi:hypothetical protein